MNQEPELAGVTPAESVVGEVTSPNVTELVASRPGDDFDDEPIALFHGDRGRLPLMARRALVLLLKSTYVSGDSYPQEWAALLEDESLITSILNDLFLVLVIDIDSKIAYKVQATSDGDDNFNTLLVDRPLSITEMRVLLKTRQLLAQSRAVGEERTVVDGSMLLDHLEEFYPAGQGDHIKARARDASGLRALVKDGVLIPPHGEKDADPAKTSYTVSKVVETILTPQRLEQFVKALQEDQQEPASGEEAKPQATLEEGLFDEIPQPAAVAVITDDEGER